MLTGARTDGPGLIAAAIRETGTDAALMDPVAQQYRKAADCGHGRAG